MKHAWLAAVVLGLTFGSGDLSIADDSARDPEPKLEGERFGSVTKRPRRVLRKNVRGRKVSREQLQHWVANKRAQRKRARTLSAAEKRKQRRAIAAKRAHAKKHRAWRKRADARRAKRADYRKRKADVDKIKAAKRAKSRATSKQRRRRSR
jgi:hypothetical protein